MSRPAGEAETGWTGHLPPTLTETPEELAYELRAAEASFWTGTRLVIGIAVFVLSSLAFAYFYLRSLNSESLWRPGGLTAPDGDRRRNHGLHGGDSGHCRPRRDEAAPGEHARLAGGGLDSRGGGARHNRAAGLAAHASCRSSRARAGMPLASWAGR